MAPMQTQSSVCACSLVWMIWGTSTYNNPRYMSARTSQRAGKKSPPRHTPYANEHASGNKKRGPPPQEGVPLKGTPSFQAQEEEPHQDEERQLKLERVRNRVRPVRQIADLLDVQEIEGLEGQ